MSSFMSTWHMVAKRSRAHWRLLSAVVIGVVLAVTIMSSTVIYYDALRELALDHSMSQYEDEELHLLIRGDRGPTNPQEYQKVNDYVTGQIDRRVAWFLKDRYYAGKSATFFLTELGQPLIRETSRDRAFYQFYPNLEAHTRVVEGRLPQAIIVAPGTQPEIEVAIDARTAAIFEVTVGDRLVTIPYWDDINPQATTLITGIIEPTSPDEEYWLIERKSFLSQSASFRFAPLFVPQQTFLEGVGALFPRMTSTYAWLLAVEPDTISADVVSRAKFGIDSMEDEIGSTLTSYRQTSVLSNVLDEYERSIFFARVPIFIVLILIATVILYYVITLSSLLVEQHKGEVALLRSRGASFFQILIVFIMEGVMISTLAIVVGPLLASATISVLGLTPAFSDLSGGSLLSATISKEAIYMSLLGGGLGFLALMIPAIQASRIGVVHHKQQMARPTSTPAYQRYYLDVVLLLIAIFLFRQLSQQGSVLTTQLFGEVVEDKLLLALPAIILVATAMVLLRLFPLVMRLSSRLLSPRLPAGLALGLWQMARNPTHYARLSLLLILTAGLGIFAASFGGTLERSFRERALYSTGSEVRVSDVVLNNSGPTIALRESYQEIPGISLVSPTYRGGGGVLSGFSGERYTILAVEPDTFSSVAWFRDDFAGDPIPALLKSLPHDNLPQSIQLPKEANALGVWVRPDRPHPGVLFQARLYDSNGRYFTYYLGTLDFTGWRLLNTSLIRSSRGRAVALQPVPPLNLVSLSVMNRNGRSGLLAGSIVLDDIQVKLPSGQISVLEDYRSIENWSVLRTAPQAITDSLQFSEEGGRGGTETGVFVWSGGSAFLSRGMFLGPPSSPIPALASTSFLKDTGHSIGDELDVSVSGTRVRVRLLDTVDYFPTLDPTIQDSNRGRFLITDLNSLIRYVNIGAEISDLQPNEIWLSSEINGVQRSELLETLEEQPFYVGMVHDRETELANSQVDPLVAAGWRALLFVAFSAVLLLSTIGFLVHAYVSFRNRELEFALLRTIGLSLRQLIGQIWLEQVLIIGAGMALGTWMGGRLGTTIMPFLGNTEEGTQVLPPFILEVNWGALAITYAIIVVLFSITILGVIRFIHKIPLQRVLRLGEM